MNMNNKEVHKLFNSDVNELKKNLTEENIIKLIDIYTFSKREYCDYVQSLYYAFMLYDNYKNGYGPYIIAYVNLMTDYEKKDHLDGLTMLNMAISLGNSEAILLQGEFYYKGLNAYPKDLNKAIKLFEKAISLGNTKALVRLGDLYSSEYRSPFYIEKADNCYLEAIKQGNSRALISMGITYHMSGNSDEAIKYYKKCFDKECEAKPYSEENLKGEAAYMIGEVYYMAYEYGRSNTLKQAIDWFRIAIDYNYLMSVSTILEIYHNDLVHPKYKDETFLLDIGNKIINNEIDYNPDSNQLAEIYALLGEVKYREKDYDSAFKYLLEAYKNDDSNEIIVMELALLYYYGKGHPIDVMEFNKLVDSIGYDPIEFDYRYLNKQRDHFDIREISIVINNNLDTY